MGTVEQGVAEHYSAYDVLGRIRTGLQAMGLDPDNIQPGAIAPVQMIFRKA